MVSFVVVQMPVIAQALLFLNQNATKSSQMGDTTKRHSSCDLLSAQVLRLFYDVIKM
jgi:hypothetical protein